MTDARSILAASSATTGFFQSLPQLPPQYTASISEPAAAAPNSSSSSSSSARRHDDPVIGRILSLYLPTPTPAAVDSALHDFSRKTLDPDTLRYTVDAEANPPTLHPLTTFGEENRVDALRTSEGWRALKDIGIAAGTVAHGHDTKDAQYNKRIQQFATVTLWGGSSAMVTCPAAMTDGAAILLGRHLNDPDGGQPGRGKVFKEARRRLVSFDPKEAWTSGQWMTERSGGSDVSGTETRAQRLTVEGLVADDRAFESSDTDVHGMMLGPWAVDGFKWFSSATDADMAVLLARTKNGISAFFAPMRRRCGDRSVMNGVRILRLKDKLGTKPLPTAELEIKGMRAWLIGEEGKGVKEISAILNSTRLWTSNGGVCGWARGLAVARAFSHVRKVKGELLTENKQHMAWMADLTVRYRAFCHLHFLGVALQGVADQGTVAKNGTGASSFLPDSSAEAEVLLRVLTPVLKAQCCLAGVEGLRECMESLGGVGYCENNFDSGVLNIARLFRDANVNCIWEGTTSVMAEDLVRALKGKSGPAAGAALGRLITRMLQASQAAFKDETSAVAARWSTFAETMKTKGVEELLFQGRTLLKNLELILCSTLLMIDARQDDDELATAVARRWIAARVDRIFTEKLDWKESAAMDRKIFLGEELASKARL